MSMATAAPRTVQQALTIAKQQAAQKGATIRVQDPANALLLTPQSLQETPFYVFDKSEGGFVIVSGEDKLPAIVGYADSGSFDANNLPEGLRQYLKQYAAVVASVAAGNTIYGDQGVDEGLVYPDVEPLLGETKWDQEAPYNVLCPVYSEENPQTGAVMQVQCMTGCGATAAAQIMYYHKYPSHQPDIPAYFCDTLKIEMPAIVADNTEAGAYDWNNMLPDYQGVRASEAEILAVAKLMLHVGCAQQIEYTPHGSSSNANSVYQGFELMGYDTSLLQLLDREDFTKRRWLEVINNELEHLRPVEYLGFSSQSGHAFVLDGCDGEGLYHINWGWSGRANGYFDIAILDPGIKTGVGTNLLPDGYSVHNSMIIGITPDNAQGEQKQEVPFTEAIEYDKIVMTVSDAEGGNTFYYSPLYNYINPMVATLTNNTDREVNTVKVLYNYNMATGKDIEIDELHSMVGIDLDANETKSINVELTAPTSWYDLAVAVVNNPEDEEEEPTIFPFNMVKIDDPDLFFEIQTNATDQIKQLQLTNGATLDCLVVNDTVLEVTIIVTNQGGTYRGRDFGMGMNSTGVTLQQNEFVAGTMVAKKTYSLKQNQMDIFVIAQANDAISASSNQDVFGMLVTVPVYCQLDATGIELNEMEPATGASKRMVDGRLIIEKDGKRIDFLGRNL